MVPTPPIVIDADVVSGITGSISLTCWIIVFAPQIHENFKRKSSEGLSLMFVILWLVGDLFNVLGAVLQGVLPTMIILAVYYTLADIVLLYQCLLYGDGSQTDLVHLSPANPMNEDVLETVLPGDFHHESNNVLENDDQDSPLVSALYKILLVALVIGAGLISWYISYVRTDRKKNAPTDLVFDPLGQFFGWLCAFLYLGSRVPQILLSYRRKSCEGVSFMFFLFACIGNLTYVISILAIDMSRHYILINSSWLTGSLGTLVLDLTIFVQFFIYNESNSENPNTNTKKMQNTEALLDGSNESYGSVQ